MNKFLRQYEPYECGPDGYPYFWHQETEWEPAIKDLIREQAGHRCQRCGHPYRVGEHGNGEWSPCDERCTHGGPVRVWSFGRAETHGPDDEGDWELVPDLDPRAWMGYQGRETFRMEAQWRILTCHHLDEDKANCRWWNLLAACQRCHLSLQRRVVMDRPWNFEHKDYFKPYAAAFYGWKYLGEDLTREETMARLDELLALERRWTQEKLIV